MIQRKQTLYLFLAAVFMAATYFFNLWNSDVSHFKVPENLVSLLAMSASTLVTLISIFYYKNRKKQITFCFAALLVTILFIAVCVFEIQNLVSVSANENGKYDLPMLFPFVAILLIVLALLAIRKDDKLIKSLDRLR